MTHELIPTQTGLTLRRTDTLINITNKLLAQTGIKGISQMSDDELWEWWLSLDDKWRFLFLRQGLKLELWIDDDGYFDENFDYQVGFDWFDKELTFVYVKAIQNLTSLGLPKNQIQDISALSNLTNLTILDLLDNQIQDISALANLTNLTSLNLSDNPIQDISVLASLIELEYLVLSENPINSQDIDWLQQKLPNCEIIFER